MNVSDEELELIGKNFERYRDLCGKLGNRSEDILMMVDDLSERLATCPASSAIYLHNAFPGGLVEHSLRVLATASKLRKSLDVDVPGESLILACLFHDLGKLGTEDQERYLFQSSQWHREQGRVYEVNRDLRFSINDATHFWLQRYGVRLTEDEYLALKLADGMYDEGNREYAMKEPDLGLIVHWADLWSTREEKRMARKGLA